MANRNRNNFNNRNRNRGNKKPNREKDNYQDESMIREYNKGRRSAEGPVVTGSHDNDPVWYIPNGMMAKDVLSVSMAIPNGIPVLLNDPIAPNPDGLVDPRNYEMTVTPGIMVYDVIGTLGDTRSDSMAPINITAASLFQAIQSKNSRTPSYEAGNLMMYFVALSDAVSAYVWATRVYGTARNWEYLDRYTPEALCAAMRVDYQDITSNLANFRTGLNQVAAALQSLYLPKTIDYTNRKVFLYETIYKDAESSKAQYYLFNPAGFYKYREGGTDPAGQNLTYLQFRPLVKSTSASVTIGYQDILDMLWELIQPLRLSDDVRMIGADMIQAFGMGSMYQVQMLDETYLVKPEYNKEVLMQMENAYICPALTFAHSDLWQIAIIQNPTINAGNALKQYALKYQSLGQNVYSQIPELCAEPDNYLLNFHHENVTPEELLVASRLSTHGGITVSVPPSGQFNNVSVVPYTTEIVAGARIYYYNASQSGTTLSYALQHITVQTEMSGNSLIDTLNSIMLYSRFDWSPKIRVGAINASAATPTAKGYWVSQYLHDIDNFTYIGKELMYNTNYMSMLGLFTPKLPDVTLSKS